MITSNEFETRGIAGYKRYTQSMTGYLHEHQQRNVQELPIWRDGWTYWGWDRTTIRLHWKVLSHNPWLFFWLDLNNRTEWLIAISISIPWLFELYFSVEDDRLMRWLPKCGEKEPLPDNRTVGFSLGKYLFFSIYGDPWNGLPENPCSECRGKKRWWERIYLGKTSRG